MNRLEGKCKLVEATRARLTAAVEQDQDRILNSLKVRELVNRSNFDFRRREFKIESLKESKAGFSNL